MHSPRTFYLLPLLRCWLNSRLIRLVYDEQRKPRHQTSFTFRWLSPEVWTFSCFKNNLGFTRVIIHRSDNSLKNRIFLFSPSENAPQRQAGPRGSTAAVSSGMSTHWTNRKFVRSVCRLFQRSARESEHGPPPPIPLDLRCIPYLLKSVQLGRRIHPTGTKTAIPSSGAPTSPPNRD